MESEKKLPHYNIVVEEDFGDGLEFVSLVADPAIMEMGLAFKKVSDSTEVEKLDEQSNGMFDFQFNKEKQVVVGPAMIPDVPLYRRHNGEEFYVVFTKEVIEKLVEKFNKTAKEHKINVDHADVVESAFIKSNWIIEDKDNDKSNMYGFDLPSGTWMLEVKVEDVDFWKDQIKESGKFGFSVEGMFGLEFIGEFNTNQNKESKMKIDELSAEELALIEKFRSEKEEVEVKAETEETKIEAEVEVEEEEEKVEVEAEIEEEKEEEKEAEEVSAEEEEVIEEVKEEVKEGIDEAAIMELVQPKIDELMEMIAELKKMMDEKEVEDEANAGGEAQDFSRVDRVKMFRKKFL